MKHLISYELLKENVKLAKQYWSEYEPNGDNIYIDFLQNLLRKTPNFIGDFMLLIIRTEHDTNMSIESIKKTTERCYNLYRKYNQLFKNIDFKAFVTLEKLEDNLNNTIIESDNINFVKSFISKKYEKVIDHKTIQLFALLKKEFGLDRNKINELIIKKIAAYQTPEEFNTMIETVMENLRGDSKNYILNKIKNSDATITFENDHIIIANIPSYETMQKLGSPSWCIYRSDFYWDEYLLENDVKTRNQYIIWDFSKDNTDPEFMIGVTVQYPHKYYAAHYMDDSEAETESYFKYKDYLKAPSTEELQSRIGSDQFIMSCRYNLIDNVKTYLDKQEIGYNGISVSKLRAGLTAAANNDNSDIVKLIFDSKFVNYLIDNEDVGNDLIKPIINTGSYKTIQFLLTTSLKKITEHYLSLCDVANYAIWIRVRKTEMVKLAFMFKEDYSLVSNLFRKSIVYTLYDLYDWLKQFGPTLSNTPIEFQKQDEPDKSLIIKDLEANNFYREKE